MLFGRRKPGYTTTVDAASDPEQVILELQKAEMAAKKKPKAEVFDIDAASETARRLPAEETLQFEKKNSSHPHRGFPCSAAAARAAGSGEPPSAGQSASCPLPECADILRRRFDFPVKTSPLLFHLPF